MELNEKLAKWAGFRNWNVDGIAISSDNVLTHGLLFTESLDACFKWLVPKLNELGYLILLQQDGSISKHWYVELGKGYFPYRIYAWEKAETAALALCPAIEKLIDKEVSDEVIGVR